MASKTLKDELNENNPFRTDSKQDNYTPPEKAKGMIIYPEVKHMTDNMTDTQAGVLFKALLSFFVDGEEANIKDSFVYATFQMCRDRIIDNNDKYRRKCYQNHKNRKGAFDIDGNWDETLPQEYD